MFDAISHATLLSMFVALAAYTATTQPLHQAHKPNADIVVTQAAAMPLRPPPFDTTPITPRQTVGAEHGDA